MPILTRYANTLHVNDRCEKQLGKITPPKNNAAMRENGLPFIIAQTASKNQVHDALVYWVRAWFGTAIGGGLFGMGIGMLGLPMGEIGFVFIGAVMGFLLAAIIAIPVHLVVATLSWAFWLGRYRRTITSFAGGLTGFVATGPVLFDSGSVRFDTIFAIFIAVTLGSFGSLYAVRKQPYPKKENVRWQFSMRDLFKRMTALAILTFVLNFLIRAIFNIPY